MYQKMKAQSPEKRRTGDTGIPTATQRRFEERYGVFIADVSHAEQLAWKFVEKDDGALRECLQDHLLMYLEYNYETKYEDEGEEHQNPHF